MATFHIDIQKSTFYITKCHFGTYLCMLSKQYHYKKHSISLFKYDKICLSLLLNFWPLQVLFLRKYWHFDVMKLRFSVYHWLQRQMGLGLGTQVCTNSSQSSYSNASKGAMIFVAIFAGKCDVCRELRRSRGLVILGRGFGDTREGVWWY